MTVGPTVRWTDSDWDLAFRVKLTCVVGVTAHGVAHEGTRPFEESL